MAKNNWIFLKDAMKNENTGTWISKTDKYNKYVFIKVQEWTEGYICVMKGLVNLSSKKINKNEAALFAGVSPKEKEKLVEAVLSYYGNDSFVEIVDWVDESEFHKLLNKHKEVKAA